MDTIISILDVGHGNSAIVHNSEKSVIIDAGPKDGILNYLLNRNIKKISHVVLSHSDADHIGGLINVISSEKFVVDTVWLNTDSLKSSVIKEDLEWAVHKSTSKMINSITPDSFPNIEIGEAEISVLAPSAYLSSRGPGQKDHKNRLLSTNSISALIQVSKGDKNIILFPGDLDEVGLANIEEDGNEIASDILVFPHHGGSSGQDIGEFTKKLLTLVKPSRVIFSIGRNKFKNPDPDIIKKIKEYDPNIWISCTQLSTYCAVEEIKNQGNYVDRQISKGFLKNECCAGSIELNISQTSLKPDQLSHKDFISKYVPAPLCR